MNLAISSNAQKALLAASSFALVAPAAATVDFKNRDSTLQGRIDAWLLDDHYFNAIRPCGDFYQLLDGWHWLRDVLGKMVRVPGISTQVGLAGADAATMQCVQRAMQDVESHDDKVIWGVVFGVAATAGAAALGVYVARSGLVGRAKSAVTEASTAVSAAAHAVLHRTPEVTPQDFELSDADAVWDATDIEANLPRPPAEVART